MGKSDKDTAQQIARAVDSYQQGKEDREKQESKSGLDKLLDYGTAGSYRPPTDDPVAQEAYRQGFSRKD